MKTKISILGSTGSIGRSLLDIIHNDKKNFEIILLTANKNYKELNNQCKKFKVKNVIIKNKNSFNQFKKINKNNSVRVFNSFKNLDKILKSKIDYTMSSIVGIDGLEPTLKIIKFTKKIVIANKESLICASNLIFKELNKHKTKFIPVDSEHFSIWYSLKNNIVSNIDKIFITASGGPFLNLPLSKFSKIKIKDAIKHPKWKMGKKISVDSSTLMNKVFEVIEAKNIFNIEIKNLNILIHKDSYLHAIIKFKDGLTKLIIHETDMKIPIFNTLYENKLYKQKNNKLSINKINNLNLQKPNTKKFPMIKVLKKIPKKNSLFETIIVSTNDTLVDLFLKNKIKYKDIPKIFYKVIEEKSLEKYLNISPKSVNQILKLKNIVQKKIETRYIVSK